MQEKPLCEHLSHYEPKQREKRYGFDEQGRPYEYWTSPCKYEYFQYEFPNHWFVVEHDPFSRLNLHQLVFLNTVTFELHRFRVRCQHSGICHELLTITSWSEFFDYIHDMETGTYSKDVSVLPLRDAISTRHEPTLFDYDNPF